MPIPPVPSEPRAILGTAPQLETSAAERLADVRPITEFTSLRRGVRLHRATQHETFAAIVQLPVLWCVQIYTCGAYLTVMPICTSLTADTVVAKSRPRSLMVMFEL